MLPKDRISKGDVIKLKKYIKLDWIDKPEVIIVQDIYEKIPNSNWVVIKINGTFKDSSGNEMDHVLFENATKDLKATRDLIISRLLDPDVSDED